MKKYLRQHPPKEHWHVSPDGEVIDLFQGALTTIIEMDPFEFMEKIAFLLDNRTPEYPRQWENFCKELPDRSCLIPKCLLSDHSFRRCLLRVLCIWPIVPPCVMPSFIRFPIR